MRPMDPPWIDGPSHWGDPEYEKGVIEMDERDRDSRLEALALAVRHPLLKSDSAEKIIEDAEKYFTFLKGDEEDSN